MISFSRKLEAEKMQSNPQLMTIRRGPSFTLAGRRLFQSNVDGLHAAGLRHFYDCFGCGNPPLTHIHRYRCGQDISFRAYINRKKKLI